MHTVHACAGILATELPPHVSPSAFNEEKHTSPPIALRRVCQHLSLSSPPSQPATCCAPSPSPQLHQKEAAGFTPASCPAAVSESILCPRPGCTPSWALPSNRQHIEAAATSYPCDVGAEAAGGAAAAAVHSPHSRRRWFFFKLWESCAHATDTVTHACTHDSHHTPTPPASRRPARHITI